MLHYLALGDSYTCGELVPADQSFPFQLVQALRQQQLEIADPTIVAVTGWTTGELQSGIAAASLQPPYDLVTLLIGVNNQYRGEAKGYTRDQYRLEFNELLQQAIQFAGNNTAKVIVLSIPDWGAMPVGESSDRAAISADIDAYNAINRELTTAQQVTYLDVTPISREALASPDFVASDGLHPTAAMYARWVELLTPLALAKLRS